MRLIDLKKLKSNGKSILIMLLFIIVLIAVESFISPKENAEETLGDGEIRIDALVINEVMTSNKGAYADESGNVYDWIELYNGTSADIDLSGYGLSDEESGNTKWIFPSATIKSKGYLIVYLSGKTEEGLHANFALSKAGGETITLKKKNGKVVDTVKTISLNKNTVMARNEKGKWVETEEITPGYSNNTDGRKEYLKSLSVEEDSLEITEFLPSNKGNISFDKKFYSYIEIHNKSDKEVSLKEYFVSNDLNRPFQYRLPDKILKPDEVYLIYTSELGADNHASFSLNKKTGTVILSKNNKIVEQVNYEDVTNGFAYIKDSTGNFQENTNITPGYLNSNMEEFSKNERKNPKELIINEVMSANHSYLAQNGGEYYDWIELYNNTDHSISLKEYFLTTSSNEKTMYNLPDKELKSGEYYIVMASGDTKLSSSKYPHANFKISSSESIYLYHSKELADSIYVSNIPIGYSYGRNSTNGFYYFEKPTPGTKNGKSDILEIAYEPTFSKEPGIYNNTKDLAVELKGSGTIYYTLDGSIPTRNSKVYNSPILLNETTVIKAVSYEKNKKLSNVVTGSYIVNENHTLPVLSISLPSTSFRYLTTNLNSTTLTVNAHAELFEKEGSFTIDCGLKLFGGQTRFISKKSFALKFSSKYGPSKLNYKVFDNRDAISYKTLVVRSGSQDSTGSMFRDELATSIMDDYSTVDVQAYKAVILYINGEYWGVYFLREKVDDEFVAHHYNVDSKATNIIRIDNVVSEGSASDYNKLVSYIRSHNLANSDAYEYVKERLDIDNYIDWTIGQLYTVNNDIVNTRYFNNPNVDGGKIKMVFYDFDFAFYHHTRNQWQWLTNPAGLGEYHYNNTILRGLLQNSEFREKLLERLSYSMKNVWSDENVMNRYQELYELLKPEMKRNQERWRMTYKEWEDNCESLKNYIKQRRSYIITHTKSYFHLSSEEVKKYFG